MMLVGLTGFLLVIKVNNDKLYHINLQGQSIRLSKQLYFIAGIDPDPVLGDNYTWGSVWVISFKV